MELLPRGNFGPSSCLPYGCRIQELTSVGQARAFSSCWVHNPRGSCIWNDPLPCRGVSAETHIPGTPILNTLASHTSLGPPCVPGRFLSEGLSLMVPHPHSVHLLLQLQDQER